MLNHPGKMMIVGFLLLLVGVIVPFLMMLRTIESTFFLNFMSYTATITGLFLGVIGAALYLKESRKS